MASEFAQYFMLDPDVVFLNHGSFGACPRVVLEKQQSYRDQLEREPVQFFIREMQPVLDRSRATLADFIGADASDLAFVPNATSGVNAVLRSLSFATGDEMVITDHAYNACRNAVDYVASKTGANVITAHVPFPIESAQQVTDAILACVTDRTRLAVIDHITSPTALVFPIAQIIRELAERGVDTLVDGAHAPGMVQLSLNELGAAYYTGNCHKWLFAPKSAAFLHVRRDRHSELQPTAVSHGFNIERDGYSRFQDNFDWIGTIDPTPWMCVQDGIAFAQSLLLSGVTALMKHNHEQACAAREAIGGACGLDAACPENMLGSMATLVLPEDERDLGTVLDRSTVPTPTYRRQTELMECARVEVPVFFWPRSPQVLLRISAQVYNREEDYATLACALNEILNEK